MLNVKFKFLRFVLKFNIKILKFFYHLLLNFYHSPNKPVSPSTLFDSAATSALPPGR
jgi:hypothetical protein